MASSAANGKSHVKPNPTVVVVGAGFAGTAAAAALREGGLKDVLVLEAQQQPGGRVQKIPLDGGFAEPGAQFIHGEQGNYLYELANKYHLLLDKQLYQGGKTADSSAEDYRDHSFFTSRGDLVQSGRVTQLLRVVNKVLRDYANSFFADREESPFTSGDHGYQATNGMKSSIANSCDNQAVSKDTYSSACSVHCNGSSNTVKTLPTNSNDYIVDFRGATISGSRKDENTFAEILDKSREILAKEGEGPEDIKQAILKWVEQWEYTDNGARLEEVSLQAYGKYGYIPGYGLTLSCSGLRDIFLAFLKDSLPSESLLLNTPVKTIFWTEQDPEEGMLTEVCAEKANTVPSEQEENGIKERRAESNGTAEKCKENGTTDDRISGSCFVPSKHKSKPVKVVCENGEEYWADHVIVTSSMGYLQKNETSMFKPMLPEEMRRAVHQMGFANVAKVFLVWDDLDDVLDSAAEGVQFLWLEGQYPRPPSDRAARKTKKGGNWYDLLQGFERVTSHKGMLLTWLAGEEADIMEEIPEEEVKDVLYELMVQFTGNRCLPAPKQVIRSMWHSNPYILGGYSYISAHMEPDTHNTLAQPLPSKKNPLLQLSGEATSHRFFSSVHGAIDSGRRAANNLLRHYNL